MTRACVRACACACARPACRAAACSPRLLVSSPAARRASAPWRASRRGWHVARAATPAAAQPPPSPCP
eukprot:5316710-Pleurochrysis_carterae.AAC.2